MNKMPKKKSPRSGACSVMGRGYLIRFFWCWYASGRAVASVAGSISWAP